MRIKRIDPFSSDVLKIISGTTIAQIITLLSYPIITRLYGPELFGILALFLSIGNILTVISCLRYENAIVLPKNDNDAINIVGLCLIITTLITIILSIIILLFGQQLVTILNVPSLVNYIWFLPVFVFINGLFLTLNYWNTRTKHFGRLSIAKIIGSLFTNGIQLGLGIIGYISGIGLIIGVIIGQTLSTTALGVKIWQGDFSIFKSKMNVSKIVLCSKRYSNFPRYDLWSAFLNTISAQLPVVLLAVFFTTTIVGYYSLALMVLLFPTTLIGGAIAQVFFQRASEAHNIDRAVLKELVELTLTKLLIIGILPFFILIIFGHDLFLVIFGSSWGIAGDYSQILAIWIFLAFIASPISTLFAVFEKQDFSLFLNIITFIARFIAICIGGILGNPVISVTLFSIVGIMSVGGSLIWLTKKANVSAYSIFKKIDRFCYIVCLVIFIAIVLKCVLNLDTLMLLFISCIGMGSYYIYVLKTNEFFT